MAEGEEGVPELPDDALCRRREGEAGLGAAEVLLAGMCAGGDAEGLQSAAEIQDRARELVGNRRAQRKQRNLNLIDLCLTSDDC